MDFEYNIRGILHLFFRQKKKLLLTFFIIFIPGFLMTLNLEPYYETKSSILLNFGQNARLEVNLQNGGGSSGGYVDRNEILQSNVQIFKSTDLIKKALSDLDIDSIFPDLSELETEIPSENKLQKAAGQVRKNLQVFAGKDNHLIGLSYRHADPEVTVQVSKQLIEAFKKRHTEIYETPQINFLKEQADKAQLRLNESRETLIAFKKEMGISEIDQEIDQLLKQKNDLSSITFRSITEAQENLAALEARAAEMRATYKSNSPVMKSIRESIAVAKAQLRERQADMVNLDKEVQGTFAFQTAAIDERITWLELQRGKFNELEQQVALDEENAKYYRQRMEEARVNSMLNDQNITRISVIDEPIAPLNPAGPNKKMILIAVTMLAGVFAAGIAILYEIIDDRFSYPNQIRSRLGLSVLATFSEAEGRSA